MWGILFDAPFNIYWFVWAQTFSYVVTGLVAYFILIKNTQKVKIKMNKIFTIALLKQSYPYALLILLMTVYYRSDGVMLERMLVDGKEQVGMYARGFRFFEAANNIALLFAVILLPLFARLIKQKKNIENLTALSFKMMFVASFSLAITCYYFQVPIIGIRYETFNAETPIIFGVLMMSFVFISITYIFGTLLTANGSLKTLNKIALAGMVLNLVLNFILIPTYKAYGAAVASLITQALTAIAQIYLAKKYFDFKVNYKLMLRLLIFTSLLVLANELFVNEGFIQIKWYFSFLLILIISFVLSLVLQVFNLKSIKELLVSSILKK